MGLRLSPSPFSEASNLFQHRHRSAALLLASAALSMAVAFAQTGAPSTQPSSAPDPVPSQTPDQTADQVTGQPAEQTGQQTTQQRAQVLRDAQARVNARRHIREQQVEQDTYTHKYELYAGGGYLRFRPGHNLQHTTEGGWNVGITEWVRPKLGITGDFRGYYGTAITDNFQFQVFKPSISQYTFMGGPQYRFFQGQHWSWNAQVLAGVTHGNFSTGTGGFPADLVGLYPDGNQFALSVGAAVDYNLSPGLAIRLMPDYLLTTYGSDIQHNLGFNIGVVYRFGRQ